MAGAGRVGDLKEIRHLMSEMGRSAGVRLGPWAVGRAARTISRQEKDGLLLLDSM